MKKIYFHSINVVLWLFISQTGFSQKEVFEPTVQSLQQYECPNWFRDAKFGIYCHWNAQTAGKRSSNGWYARDMYVQGGSAYKDHLKNWGHPSGVGYKEVIKSWKADKPEPEKAVQLSDLLHNWRKEVKAQMPFQNPHFKKS